MKKIIAAIAILAFLITACGFWDQPSTCPKAHPNCGGPDDRAVPYPLDPAFAASRDGGADTHD